MRNFLLYIILISSTLLLSCEVTDIYEIDDPNYLKISGSYEADIFYEPGQADGGIDILSNGGKLSAKLFADKKAEFYVYIPVIENQGFTPRDTVYNASFSISNDTVYFFGSNIFDKPFVIKGDTLEYRLSGFVTYITRLVKVY